MGNAIFKDNTKSKCKCYKCSKKFYPFDNGKKSYGLYCNVHKFKQTKRGTICSDCGVLKIHKDDDKLLTCYHVVNHKKYFCF